MNLNALIEPSALPSGHTLALSRNLPTLLEPRDLSALLRNIRASGAKCVHPYPTPTPPHPIPFCTAGDGCQLLGSPCHICTGTGRTPAG
jgi:hypothetical protein